MASSLLAGGSCPKPFLNLEDYPYQAGYNASRMCSKAPTGATCCLPCPMTDWVYPDSFGVVSKVAGWVSVGSLICTVFMLLSFAVLPVERTSRHYLTVCLISSCSLVLLSSIVPLAVQPNQCYDAITPNDMRSDLTCAWSGALVAFGGFSTGMWVFIRALSLYLQICWQIVPGRLFFILAQVGGWGISALLIGFSFGFSGVSYRFGNTCYLNHVNSLSTFWIELLVITGAATILQFVTFAYCVRVYLQALGDKNPQPISGNSTLPSHTGSSLRPTNNVRRRYRRVRKVVAMQWRGFMVVMILIVTVVDLAIVFLKLDNSQTHTQDNIAVAQPWLTCLYINNGDKNKCLDKVGGLVMSESSVTGVLFLLATIGFWCLIFMGRLSMFAGWVDFILRREDTREALRFNGRHSPGTSQFEMLKSPGQTLLSRHSVMASVGPPQRDDLPADKVTIEKCIEVSSTPIDSEAASSSSSSGHHIDKDFEDPDAIRPTDHASSFSRPRQHSREPSRHRMVTFTRDSDDSLEDTNETTLLSPNTLSSKASLRVLTRSPPAPAPAYTAMSSNRPESPHRNGSGGSTNNQYLNAPRSASAASDRSGSAAGGATLHLATVATQMRARSPSLHRTGGGHATSPSVEWDPQTTFAGAAAAMGSVPGAGSSRTNLSRGNSQTRTGRANSQTRLGRAGSQSRPSRANSQSRPTRNPSISRAAPSSSSSNLGPAGSGILRSNSQSRS